jgi:hypothetical protein
MLCFREELIHLSIDIPESCFGKFVLGFGRVFHKEDPIWGVSWLKKIDNYSDHNAVGLCIDISFPISYKIICVYVFCL